MDIKLALQAVIEQRDLTTEEMASVMRIIMTGQATPAQIGGFLIGLRMKGETVTEIAAATQIMRELVTSVTVNKPHVVDIVGTGGDGSSTFNISTTSALVVAAAGGAVAKHGNRSISSKSGSADVLEALGVNINLIPEQVSECVNKIGIGFMFAPLHHNAMKHAIGPRREMGVRTIFNLLGPLTNPAAAPNQLLGVFSKDWVEPIAQVLQKLGSKHVLVVHSNDGLDEISIAAPTFVAELNNNNITTYTVTPDKFGLQQATSLADIKVNSVAESVALVQDVLANKNNAATDVVVFNSGAGIYAAGLTDSLATGIERAKEVLSDGSAKRKLTDWVELTQSF
ncbi:MAG: anthranilate phosphoribosyltransferase [Candidatus Marithrix sp.]|nr:anthranilate phosphoribosyltransferase [Candidatus Marithrix sp.]